MNDTTQPVLDTDALIRRHLRHGWLGLGVFVLLGISLEVLHAWKSAAYLGADHEIRRLMWTLAHAHGIGLSLVQLGYAATLGLAFKTVRPGLIVASHCLNWATLLIPCGFFSGGVTTYEGDPGFGVLLVPIGALLLIVALACIVIALTSGAPNSRHRRD